MLLKFLSLHHLDISTEFKFLMFSYSICSDKEISVKADNLNVSQYNGYVKLSRQPIIREIQKMENQGEMQCSCMALMSAGWTLLKPILRWQTSDSNDILLNGDLIFKSINKFRYFDMPNILKIKNFF